MPQNETRTTLSRACALLADLETRHAQGEPVYAEMAARIEAQSHIEADAMIHEALSQDETEEVSQ